ncbi:MAG: UDP-glucose/GDP-mannose dehydrogenase family protein [Euryarchaeota archaeon]|nr:MAG: UDP-glucose 6-dehydrogenase AglM [ANME-2 cluster archaeon]MEA1865242.1 UDP-glucose/GDP-mannose dehydrogenase family protein [Euryarchaeota archaeon]
MDISIIGTGYVGTVTGACFAELGHNVVSVDIDSAKVAQINAGISPIYEPGLSELLKKHAGTRLRATSDYNDAISSSDVTFICVGTPSDEDGNIDLSIVRSASKSIGDALALAGREQYHVVVVKSTVVPATTDEVVAPLVGAGGIRGTGEARGADVGIAMNPEFLREGKAVYDFMNPDKIVIGGDTRAAGTVASLYENISCEITLTDTRTAEMIKYANNSFLATKISFANEIGNVCKKLGIDVYEVMAAIGKDYRISKHFLNAGAGFGGSCFPKDVKALIGRAKELGYDPILLNAVIEVNEEQPMRMIELLTERVGDLRNKRIAVLGLAFKNDTDDIRETRSIPVITELLNRGATVAAYDPLAAGNMRKVFSNIEYCKSAGDALSGSDACLIMTEWDEFGSLDQEFDAMKEIVVIDGRRMVSLDRGLYEGICW